MAAVDEVVRKLEEPPEGARNAGAGEFSFVVRASSLAGQRKLGAVWSEDASGRRSSSWEIHCDEGRALGGDDSAPTPLMYFAAGLAF
jgi:hypothetical protein